jgi:hypothetical protein
LLDLNSDGRLDLLGAHQDEGTLSILMQEADGSFASPLEYPAGIEPRAIAPTDLDGDGDLDLAIANFTNGVRIQWNLDQGAFDNFVPATMPVGNAPQAVAIGLVNGDLRPDIVVVNRDSDSISVLHNIPTGGFVRVDYYTGDAPQDIALADLNGDGHTDIAVARPGRDRDYGDIAIHLNTGLGTFTPAAYIVSIEEPSSIALADMDADGDMDIAVAGLEGESAVLLNDGAAQFTTHATIPVGARNIAFNDMDGNGVPDVVLVDYQFLTVVLAQADLTFAEPQSYELSSFLYGIELVDLNGDSALDVVVSAQSPNSIHIFFNVGNGTLAPAMILGTDGTPTKLKLADLDLDGDLEILAYDHSQRHVSIFRNEGNAVFTRYPSFEVGTIVSGLATGDLNMDGAIDLVGVGQNTLGILYNSFDCYSCPADLNSDHVLDYFDLQVFLNAWSNQSPLADVNHDGVVNFFDVQAYLASFSIGCP